MAIDLQIKKYQGGNPTMDIVSEDIGDTSFITLLAVSSRRVYEGLVQVEISELDAGVCVVVRVAGWPIWEKEFSKVYFPFKDPSTNILGTQINIFNQPTPGNGYFIPVFFSSACKDLLVEVEVTGIPSGPFPMGTSAVIKIGAGVDSSGVK
jgi:hypothetical protein